MSVSCQERTERRAAALCNALSVMAPAPPCPRCLLCCRIVEFEQLQENVIWRRNYHVPLKTSRGGD